MKRNKREKKDGENKKNQQRKKNKEKRKKIIIHSFLHLFFFRNFENAYKRIKKN